VTALGCLQELPKRDLPLKRRITAFTLFWRADTDLDSDVGLGRADIGACDECGLAAQIPTPPDVLLLVEISDSSLAFAQSTKRALYARHGVAEYWVVDIPGRRIHVYCEPTAEGYGEAFARAQTDIVSPRALPAVQVTAGTLFA
jgi:hypothetical protein